VASLSLAGVLAWQAIGTSRRHRVTAERTLRDYAEFGASILASITLRRLGGDVAQTFTWWPVKGLPNTLPEGTGCPAGTVYILGGTAPNEVKLSGLALPPADAAFLRDTLRFVTPLLKEAGWRFRYVRVMAGPVEGYFVGSLSDPAGAHILRGFSACLGEADSPFRQAMLAEHALPPSVTAGLPADSLYSIAVTAGGAALYTSPRQYVSPYGGASRLGTEFGDLTLRLALRPDAADRLVIGGIPSSPTPLALGLLGLSTLLVVTALMQLRREYQLIAIRSDFVANVSHELRTPLSQLLIFTELLKLNRLRSPAERERALEIMDRETRRLIRLVENVLQFSGAGARRRIERERVPLAALVQETLDAFRPLADARDVALKADVPAGTAVRGDASALRQILLNLLDNAVKYGPRGQTVSVTAKQNNGRTRILVEDQGPGIPLEDRERVWEGYYRLQREVGSAVAGSGIGLAVVRALVREMNGRTWIEDCDTGGTRFLVELGSDEEPAG
jgi:signal transduction histidine kinase